jgi:dTMP kinase
MARPLFIVFDGIDGNGKSTQARLLKEYLEKRGFEVFETHEPSHGEYGQQIENLLRKREAASLTKQKWLELFTLDRKDNIREILGALQEGKMIICDRYYYSTLAYQLDEQEWQYYASEFLKPDIVFILDIDPKIAIERLKEKYKITGEKKAFFEKLNILTLVRKKFLLLPQYLSDNIKIIQGDRQVKMIAEEIRKETDNLIK